MPKSRMLALVAGTASLMLLAAPVVAQDEAEMMEAPSVAVAGVEYAFLGLPTSVPAGTQVTFSNDGVELHEIAIARIADDTTEPLEELLAMGEEALATGKVVLVGQLFTGPGETAEGSLTLEQEGNYVALCFVSQGFDPAALEAAGIGPEDMGPDTDPSTLPEEVQAIMANPPHLALGMLQEFTVTAAGTEAGPLPEEMTEEAA